MTRIVVNNRITIDDTFIDQIRRANVDRNARDNANDLSNDTCEFIIRNDDAFASIDRDMFANDIEKGTTSKLLQSCYIDFDTSDNDIACIINVDMNEQSLTHVVDTCNRYRLTIDAIE